MVGKLPPEALENAARAMFEAATWRPTGEGISWVSAGVGTRLYWRKLARAGAEAFGFDCSDLALLESVLTPMPGRLIMDPKETLDDPEPTLREDAGIG